MVNKVRDALNIDLGTKIIYNKIKEECHGLRVTYLDIFNLAMAYGYYQSVRKPLIKKERLIRISSINDDFNSLIWLIAIDELGNDFHELNENPSMVYDIAEEYANAGIIMIEDRFKRDFDFYGMLDEIIFNLYDENNLLEALEIIK